MHILYKIGFALVGMLFILLIPMFIFLKEMAIFLAVNTAIVGTFVIIAYFLTVFVYLKFGRLKTIISIGLAAIIMGSAMYYFDWRDDRIYQEFYDFSRAQPVEMNQIITEKDQTEGALVWEKYKLVAPDSGELEVKVLTKHTPEQLGLTILDDKGNPVGLINDQAGVTLEEAIQGKTYYIVVDRRKAPYSIQLLLH